MSTALLSGEPEIPDIYDELMVGSIVPEDELSAYYSRGIPVDVELLELLGLITWAATRLQHTVRDTLGMYLGEGLSREPFELTLGSAIRDLDRAARSHGEPWASQIESWTQDVARRAMNERNRITAVAYTAADGKQALQTRFPGAPERVTPELLAHAAGLLTLAAIRLREVREGSMRGGRVSGIDEKNCIQAPIVQTLSASTTYVRSSHFGRQAYGCGQGR